MAQSKCKIKAKSNVYDTKAVEREKSERYQKGKSFEQKTGEIFKLMRFEVEYNKKIAGNEIDIFMNRKNRPRKKYEFNICECKYWKRKISKKIVNEYRSVRDGVRNELARQNLGNDCELILISSVGFTENAKKAANAHGIILNTYDELLSELMDFDGYLIRLIQDFEESPLNDLYIEQDVIPERDLEEINGFEFVKRWLENPGRKQFSLLGDYGSGKTSFAKKLAYDMAKEFKKEPGSIRIPFLVDLSECQKALSLRNLIHEQLVEKGVEPANEEIFLKLLGEGKILLIFDAFDEMATMSNAEITLNNFKQLNEVATDEAKVIMTSRTHYFRDKYEVDMILKKQGVVGLSKSATMLYREILGKPEYEIVYLKEFSDQQIQEYLQKAIGSEWEAAYEKIGSIYNLHDLSSRPVLLDMIVKSLPKIEKGDKEFNVVHLYEVYTYSWFEREDHRLQITKEGKKELVEELAYILWKEGKISIHHTALSNILSHHLKSKIKTTRDLEAADYEVRTASFLVRDGEGNYSFAHNSFQEFFIARKIKKELSKKKYNIIDLKLLSREIIFFLGHLIEKDKQIIRTVAGLLGNIYRENISENALLLFYKILQMGFSGQQFSIDDIKTLTTEEIKLFQENIQKHLPDQLNLQSAQLSGLTMPNTFFKNTDFKFAKLERSILTNSIFENTKFNLANMEGTDFSNSFFKNVKFEQTKVHSSNFKQCVFENCNLTKSDFTRSNFMNTSFKNCTIEKNEFDFVKFLHSDMDLKRHKNNRFQSIGKPDTDVLSLSPIVHLSSHIPVISVSISNDIQQMVSGGYEGSVKLWNFKNGDLIKTFKGHKDLVNSVFISPDNKCVVSGSDDYLIKIWDIESGLPLRTLEGHNNNINSVFISSYKRQMVSGSTDTTIKLWDLESGHLINTFGEHEGPVWSVFISPDNRQMVSGSSDETVKLWDLESGRLIHSFAGHEGPIWSVFISPDNRWIVSGGADATIKCWDLKKLHLIKTFKVNGFEVKSVSISQNNKRMVSGDLDHTIKFWDFESGRLIHTLKGHKAPVMSVFISPDNRRMISGSIDSTIKVWDIENDKCDLISTIYLLPENNYIVLFRNNKFIAGDEAIHFLCFNDGQTSYPASDLPELRLTELEVRS